MKWHNYDFHVSLDDRPELGALFGALVRELVNREQPILDKAGLSMWEYVIISTIARSDGLRQKELARRSGRDETRLIAHLDELADRGLVRRETDPDDRRAKIVTLTGAGRRVYRSCRTGIAAMEEELLGDFSSQDRRTLRRMLTDLVGRIGGESD